MAGENVGVTLTLKDNVSPKLRSISELMNKVIVGMDKFSMSALIATNTTDKLADNLERMAKSYGVLKSFGNIKMPSISEGRVVSPSTSGSALRSMKTDSGYGTDALRGNASDIKNLATRLQEIPKELEYNFTGLSERINRVVNDLKLAYATGEQFMSVLRRMNIYDVGEGLSSAMMQAQSSFNRQASAIRAMQEKLSADGTLSVEELTNAYKGLATVMTDAKNVHMQMTNVMTSGKLSSEQIQELSREYDEYILNIKAATQAVTHLGNATDAALDSPELKQAIQEYERLAQEIREAAEEKARLAAQDKAMREILKGQEVYQKAINDRIKAEETAARKAVEAERKAAAEREAIIKRFIKQGEENNRRIEQAYRERLANMRAANNELSRTGNIANSASSGINSLTRSLKGLAASFISVYSAQKLIETSDSLILSEGKLSNLTDNVSELKDNIYQMSQNTRTSYLDNMSQMAKMWQLTGGSSGIFDTEDKLLQFNEVLNKAFILGGSGTREINASLYQLTQALSSGRLQGDELRSLAENAPYLINSVIDSLENMYNSGKDQSEWIELSYKDLKDLGAQGVLTSDLIVGAVLDSTDKVRKAYENLTPTFEQITQTLKNQAIKIAEPLLKKLNEILNSEAFEKTAQVLMKLIAMIVVAFTPIINGILWIGEAMSDNWAIVEPIIWGIIGALGVYYGSLMLIKGATIAVGTVSKGLAIIQGVLKGITFMSVLAGYATGKYTRAQYNAAKATIFNSKTKVGEIFATTRKIKADIAATASTARHTRALIGASIGSSIYAGATSIASKASAAFASVMTWVNAVLLANPITWVVIAIVALVAAIYLAVKAWNHFKNDTLTVLGAVAGGVGWLGSWIMNIAIGVYNSIITVLQYIVSGIITAGTAIQNVGTGIWNAMVAAAEAICNAFIYMKNVLKNIFNTLFGWIVEGLNGIIGFLNTIIDGYNYIANITGNDGLTKFGTIEYDTKIVDNTDGFVDFSAYESKYENLGETWNKTMEGLSILDESKKDYFDPNKVANDFRQWGDNKSNEIGKGINDALMNGNEPNTDYIKDVDSNTQGILDELNNLYDDSLKNYDAPSLKGSGLTPEQAQALGNISGNTDDLADNVTVTNEQLELLRELAERRTINRFTTAEISITNNMSNTINSEMDMDGVVSYLTTELNKSLVAGAESANHY